MNSNNLPNYLSSCNIIFLVYDVTNEESFNNIDDWLTVVDRNAPAAKIHLVGNKVVLFCCSLHI
jgi:GTPase SAR1 family protein